MANSTEILATAFAEAIFDALVTANVQIRDSQYNGRNFVDAMVTGTNSGFQNLNKYIDPEEIRAVCLGVYKSHAGTLAVSFADAAAVDWTFETAKQTGTQCEVCAGWQVESPWGIVCEGGHGGAGSRVFPVGSNVYAFKLEEDDECFECGKKMGADTVATIYDISAFCNVACVDKFTNGDY